MSLADLQHHYPRAPWRDAPAGHRLVPPDAVLETAGVGYAWTAVYESGPVILDASGSTEVGAVAALVTRLCALESGAEVLAVLERPRKGYLRPEAP